MRTAKAQISLYTTYVWSVLLVPANIIFSIILSLSIRTEGLCKQCRPLPDATERGVWSGSALFVTHPAEFRKINIHTQPYLYRHKKQRQNSL